VLTAQGDIVNFTKEFFVMKIAGKTIEGCNSELIPIIRPSGNIAFIAEAIISYEEFEKLCPMPTPPEIIRQGGTRELNHNDPGFKERLNKYGELKTAYTVVTSISATPDLEWETIKKGDIESYLNYTKELKESGLTENEIARLVQGVMRANSLDDKMIELARQDFLRTAAPKVQ
jgi:hypothetical protein